MLNHFVVAVKDLRTPWKILIGVLLFLLIARQVKHHI